MSITSQSLREADKAFNELFKKLPPDAKSTDPDATTLAWTTSYILMSVIAYYQYSRDEVWIERLVNWIDNMMLTRNSVTGKKDVVRDKILPAWSSGHYTEGKNYCMIVHNGMISYPIMLTTQAIMADPNLNAKYGTQAQVYLKAMEDLVAAFEPDWHPKEGSNPPTGQYYGDYYKAFLPYNQQNVLGRTLIILHELTQNDHYLDIATRLANFFKEALKVESDGGFNWIYSPKNGHQHTLNGEVVKEDISHGGIDVDFSWLCYSYNISFEESDMQSFIKTLNRIKRPENDPNVNEGYTTYVDGTGGIGNDKYQIGRWGHLGFVEEAVITESLIKFYEGINWTGNTVPCFIAAGYMCQVLGANQASSATVESNNKNDSKSFLARIWEWILSLFGIK